MSNTKHGNQHKDAIGYFVICEAAATAELEIQDHEMFDSIEQAEAWIGNKGAEDVNYWICAPIHRISFKRAC